MSLELLFLKHGAICISSKIKIAIFKTEFFHAKIALLLYEISKPQHRN